MKNINYEVLERMVQLKTPQIIDMKKCKNSRYQKLKVKQRIIDGLIHNFTEDLLDPIVVNYRDGVYWVVDGQHRWRAFKDLGHEYIFAIVYKKDEQWECDYFKNVNSNAVRGQLTPNDTIMIEVTNGTEKYQMIKCITQQNNFSLTTTSNVETKIKSLKTLVNIYDIDGKGEILNRTLRTIDKCWGYDIKGATSVPVIKGIAEFQKVFEGYVNQEWLEKRLIEDLIFPITIRRNIIQNPKIVSGNNFNPNNIMLELIKIYNKGIRPSSHFQKLKYEDCIV